MPRQKMIDLLYELMRNSKRSDRELAKVVHVSQPTITRMRKSLEKNEYVREYTVMPAFEKLGFEILAFNFVTASVALKGNADVQMWVAKNSKVMFAGTGEGLNGKTLLAVSLHRSFTDFSTFTHDLRNTAGPTATVESYLISVNSGIVKHFSFKQLEKD